MVLSPYPSVNQALVDLVKLYNKEIVVDILNEYPDVQIYLFGSCARSVADGRSDVDVAYVLPGDLRPSALYTANDYSEAIIPVNSVFVSMQDFQKNETELIKDINKEGIKWEVLLTVI